MLPSRLGFQLSGTARAPCGRSSSAIFSSVSAWNAMSTMPQASSDATTSKMGLVDSVTGDLIKVRNLETVASTNSLLLFQNGAVGCVTDVQKEASHVAVITGSPAANETAIVEQGRASFPATIAMSGRVVDALGQPIDGLGPIQPFPQEPIERGRASQVPICTTEVPTIMEREPLHQCLSTGFKLIDSFYPVLRGSSAVIVGERGSADKSRLALDFLLSMAAEDLRQRTAAASASSSSAAAQGAYRDHHFIYCAVGLPVSSVNDALISLRLSGAMPRTTVIAAPANSHVGMQLLAPQSASAFAEYLARVHGRHVVVVIDNLSNHMMATWRASPYYGSGGQASASATASASLVPAIFDRSCHLKESCGGGSITTIATIDSSAAAAVAAATSLSADLAKSGQTRGGSSSSSSSGGTNNEGSSSSPSLFSSSRSSSSSSGPSVASVAAGLTREAIKAQAYTHHICSLADTVIELERAGAAGAAAQATVSSSSASSSEASTSSSSGAGKNSTTTVSLPGQPLPLGFDSFNLRNAGHAAQGEGMRHYVHLSSIVLRQLREAALNARAARELGLEHESDVDALLDMHQKARTLLTMQSQVASASAPVSPPPSSSSSSSSAPVAETSKPHAEPAAPKASPPTPTPLPTPAPAAPTSDSGSKDSLIPDDQRKAMEALIARRAKERATRSAASMAAAAGFAIRSAASGTGSAPSSSSAHLAAKVAAQTAMRKESAPAPTAPKAAPIPEAAPAASEEQAAPASVAGGRSLRFRAPEKRSPVAQTFAAVTSSVPVWGDKQAALSGKDADDAAALVDSWQSSVYGTSFGRSMPVPAAHIEKLAPPQHGSPERTLLTLFLIAHGYVQRVPSKRVREYEEGLFRALSAMPAPKKVEEQEGSMIAETSSFSELGKKQLKEAAGSADSDDDEERREAAAFGSAAVPASQRGFKSGPATTLLEAALREPIALSELELERAKGSFLIPLTEEQQEKEKKRVAKGGKGTPIVPHKFESLSLMAMRDGSVRADISTMLRAATLRLASAAARGLSTRQDGGKSLLAAIAAEAEEKARQEAAQKAQEEEERRAKSKSVTSGFLSWLLSKPVVPPAPPKATAAKEDAAPTSPKRLDVYGSMAAPAPGAPPSPHAADAPAPAPPAAVPAEATEDDPLFAVRGHIRLEPGVAFDLLPQTWKAMHVAVAEYTRAFCGEIPLPFDDHHMPASSSSSSSFKR